ncbi:hypothetical protein NDU88_000315 [Pleurodeles waltl]|uniref:Uncharacterized protein n=1 Tax=Pleurodeles waltl TaxID=8319 RepID=A0AAV7KP58_PLEWA|nr:hypothetical protein NDU88_000315 [Pleurodeles waltl]
MLPEGPCGRSLAPASASLGVGAIQPWAKHKQVTAICQNKPGLHLSLGASEAHSVIYSCGGVEIANPAGTACPTGDERQHQLLGQPSSPITTPESNLESSSGRARPTSVTAETKETVNHKMSELCLRAGHGPGNNLYGRVYVHVKVDSVVYV